MNPQIGIPIVEKLTYTTNEEIADLFTTLLKKASVSDTINQAHPAFISIVEQLSIDEARIIKAFVNIQEVPWFTMRILYTNDQYRDLAIKATLLDSTVDFIFPNDIKVYLSNLLKLGIIQDSEPDSFLPDDKAYSTLQERFEQNPHIETEKQNPNFWRIKHIKGYFEITPFGRAFINAVAQP